VIRGDQSFTFAAKKNTMKVFQVLQTKEKEKERKYNKRAT